MNILFKIYGLQIFRFAIYFYGTYETATLKSEGSVSIMLTGFIITLFVMPMFV